MPCCPPSVGHGCGETMPAFAEKPREAVRVPTPDPPARHDSFCCKNAAESIGPRSTSLPFSLLVASSVHVTLGADCANRGSGGAGCVNGKGPSAARLTTISGKLGLSHLVPGNTRQAGNNGGAPTSVPFRPGVNAGARGIVGWFHVRGKCNSGLQGVGPPPARSPLSYGASWVCVRVV